MMRYLSWWGAIFSGAVAGFGINFLFNLMTLAFGISIFNIVENKTTFSYLGFSIFCMSAFMTMFLTGWIAARLSPPIFMTKFWGGLIGLIAWATLLIMTIFILTNMIQFTAFHSNFTSHPQLVAVRISNDSPILTETKASRFNNIIDVNIEKITKVVSLNATVTFALFALGAFASMLGGYAGKKRLRNR